MTTLALGPGGDTAGEPDGRGTVPRWVGATPSALVLLCLLVVCAALPLAVYATTLAMFGAAHVLTELRYVDRRLLGRVTRPAQMAFAVLLCSVVALRIAGMAGVLTRDTQMAAELGAVALLAASVVPALGRRGVIGAALVVAIGAGVLLAPLATFMGLAVLHNWTPVGFLAEATPSAQRRRVGLAMLVAFVLCPLLLATGAVQTVLAAVGLYLPNVGGLISGGLTANLGAYLHPVVAASSWAPWLFSAAVFAQCLHYATVIGVLPSLAPEGRGTLGALPTRWFVGAVVGVSLALFALYGVDFGAARSWYGVAAAVHAWLEVPVLLVALVPSGR